MRFVWALAPLSLVLVSCAKTKECDRVIKTINPALAEVSAKRAAAKNDSRSLVEAAAIYDQLDKDLKALNVRTRRLKRAVDDYRVVFQRAARAARALTDAIEDENRRSMNQNKRELERIVAQERVLVARMNSLCQSP